MAEALGALELLVELEVEEPVVEEPRLRVADRAGEALIALAAADVDQQGLRQLAAGGRSRARGGGVAALLGRERRAGPGGRAEGLRESRPRDRPLEDAGGSREPRDRLGEPIPDPRHDEHAAAESARQAAAGLVDVLPAQPCVQEDDVARHGRARLERLDRVDGVDLPALEGLARGAGVRHQGFVRAHHADRSQTVSHRGLLFSGSRLGRSPQRPVQGCRIVRRTRNSARTQAGAGLSCPAPPATRSACRGSCRRSGRRRCPRARRSS